VTTSEGGVLELSVNASSEGPQMSFSYTPLEGNPSTASLTFPAVAEYIERNNESGYQVGEDEAVSRIMLHHYTAPMTYETRNETGGEVIVVTITTYPVVMSFYFTPAVLEDSVGGVLTPNSVKMVLEVREYWYSSQGTFLAVGAELEVGKPSDGFDWSNYVSHNRMSTEELNVTDQEEVNVGGVLFASWHSSMLVEINNTEIEAATLSSEPTQVRPNVFQWWMSAAVANPEFLRADIKLGSLLNQLPPKTEDSNDTKIWIILTASGVALAVIAFVGYLLYRKNQRKQELLKSNDLQNECISVITNTS